MTQENTKRWLKSIVLSVSIFILLDLLFFRSTDPFYLNKLLGTTAALLAGFTLLIGPLTRIQTFFNQFMTIRRHLGLCAFGAAILHAVTSFFLLPNRFPLSWFGNEWIPIIVGLCAILTWVYIVFISRNSKIKEMGPDVWKKHQSVGARIAFLAIYLHVILLKNASWIAWFDGSVRRQPYPPVSFFLFIFMTFVILYKFGWQKLHPSKPKA
jgi:DMSO/TMAO reductase YedYZ heme-binding membrane subunit